MSSIKQGGFTFWQTRLQNELWIKNSRCRIIELRIVQDLFLLHHLWKASGRTSWAQVRTQRLFISSNFWLFGSDKNLSAYTPVTYENDMSSAFVSLDNCIVLLPPQVISRCTVTSYSHELGKYSDFHCYQVSQLYKKIKRWERFWLRKPFPLNAEGRDRQVKTWMLINYFKCMY